MSQGKRETFISLFDETRQRVPGEECYISYDKTLTRDSISFQELWTLASRFAYNLRQCGLKRGESVVVATPLSIEYVVVSFGVILAGGVQVSMEKFFPKCEMLKQTITMCQGKFLLMTDSVENDTWPFFEAKATLEADGKVKATYTDDSLPSLHTIIFTNRSNEKDGSGGLLDHLRSCTEEYQDEGLDPEEICVCVSSLNPGIATPKIVELSHRAVVNVTKLYHSKFSYFSKIHFRWPWYIGATLPFDALMGKPRVITDSYAKLSPEQAVDHNRRVIQREGLHTAVVGPPDIKALADMWTNSDSKLLRHIMSGGQPMTKAIFEVAQQVSTNIHIVYFMSESSYVTCNDINPSDSFTPFDSGYPLEGVEIRILDEDNKELPRGQTGRIAVRSPYMFTRYAGQPELTKSVWGKDGWFYSNDAGCLSSNGHLHVYGRQGDVISRGIVLTYPSWIEKPIWNIKDVIEVMAVPVPDDINFQNICACVVLRPESKLSEDDVLKLYQKTVTEDGNDFFHLDYVVFFDQALPKVKRSKLGEIAAEKLGLKTNQP